MTPRRLTTILLTPVAGIVLALLVASPAAAVVTQQQRLQALSNFTQVNSSSYNSWNSARQNQAAWAEYAFDWSTDYCSASPDQPLGFDFRMPCWRHDFGYRNYRALGGFEANKPRIDDAFYFDLRAKCATYNVIVRPACYSLAWTYYQAVKNFGNLIVAKPDIEKAAEMKREALREKALAS
jgi:hypothetical protein